MDEIKQLKSVLRSLVVSSPVQMTLNMLLRDYRNMMGTHLPIQKYGYRDPLQFLKERCGDCFLFQGLGTNTVLTPIVPECLKHIDDFVQKQNVSSKMKCKGKRRSVHESVVTPAPDLIVKTFDSKIKPRPITKTPVKEKHTPTSHSNEPDNTPITRHENRPSDKKLQVPLSRHSSVDSSNKCKSTLNFNGHNKDNTQNENVLPSKEAYKNFLRKRLPVYDSTLHLDNDEQSLKDSDSGKFTSESEQRTLSSGSSSTKALQLEELKSELVKIVEDSPNGVCCTDLMKLYRERYNRELNFSRFGYLSVSALACSLAVHVSRDVTGAVRLSATPPPAPAHPHPRPARSLSRAVSLSHAADEEDALPWIDFDPDVFPADCLSFSESIPAPRLDGAAPGAMLEVMVGEVYSPSHFWFYRLGEEYHIAMEDMMDEMTKYYTSGEGANRTLAVGAVRVGHYCSSVYERDWHRSLIVNIVDSDTVKVRHVDYGTVDRVPVRGLRPLLRCWAALPAQAVRARLAGARPAARGRRWPHAACAAFLRQVQDRRLVANVVSVDHEESIVEVFLIDTSTERDVRVDLELVRAGHADPCAHATAHLAASYLYPRFDALESGATPNFADIHAYLRDGIALEYVADYSRHVPAALPPSPPPAPAPSAAPAPAPAPAAAPLLDNRVPLHRPCPASPARSDPEPDSLESDDEPPVESFLEHVKELSAGDGSESSRESTDPPSPPVSPKPPQMETSVPEPKPECRAAPRVSPQPRHGDSRMLCSFGPPPFAAPSMPSLPFFVFPSPGSLQYSPYPMHPAFPRPYPSMEFISPPQRCFQPQLRPPYSGPGYSPPFHPLGPGPFPPYGSPPAYPACGYPAGLGPGPRPPASVAPITSTPIHKTKPVTSSVSKSSYSPTPVSRTLSVTPVSKPPHSPAVSQALPATSVSKPPILATNISRPLVSTTSTPAVTASIAPTPVPRREPEVAPAADRSGPVQGERRVATGHGDVTLSVSECEIFSLLSSVDPNAAHWYMVDAISRAMRMRSSPAGGAGGGGGSRLNPEASEFRLPAAPAPPPPLRPPPGFGSD